MSTDPYVKGWLDCAEAIAILCELKAGQYSGFRGRLLYPNAAGIYRHAAELARTTTEGIETVSDEELKP